MNYCCQSTAAATEASSGAFGGLFDCSQHTKSKAGRKNIFFVKKRAYGGTTVDPHMPIFLYEKSFFGPAGFSTVKNSQKGPQTHLGLLPLLQQCSGDGTSIPLNSPTVVAVETLFPEHCCSYGSKPGRFWASFWLFLTAENQAGPKKFFS